MEWFATIDSWLARRDDGKVSVINAPEVTFTDTHMHERHYRRLTARGDTLSEAREDAWRKFVEDVLPDPADIELVYKYKIELNRHHYPGEEPC